MDFLKCANCDAEFATYREMADHVTDAHPSEPVVAVSGTPIVDPPKVPYELNENDADLLRRLGIARD